MNTAARIEATGESGRIHLSQETADILAAQGYSKSFVPRKGSVVAKGKLYSAKYFTALITSFLINQNTQAKEKYAPAGWLDQSFVKTTGMTRRQTHRRW